MKHTTQRSVAINSALVVDGNPIANQLPPKMDFLTTGDLPRLAVPVITGKRRY
ncbi:hypothetical protein H9645_02640 [Luteimonas sp. Sa2BVA3]|uniref:Uncharacterized protein n=1 Tax=Luteimonas colneyensis TaxID=2762230 RepID=A0ABR8UH38_9GAMM|nr:hypothetical protein [Luteimonas colneyensis]MBD7986924.1 hypothetical protein [Luteimonas colneyensis]